MRKVEISTARWDSAVFSINDLVEQINDWFAEHPSITVERVLQSQSAYGDSDYHFVISIFYDEVNDGDSD
jgi:hypothetical protein